MCNVSEVVREYVNAMKEMLHVDMEYAPRSSTVKVQPPNQVPWSVVVTMAVILRERLVGREVVFEGFVGDAYIKTKARIKDVAYEGEEPLYRTKMNGFVFTLETLEPNPRTFEIYMAINGEISAVNLLNSALLIHNNPWLVEEIASAAREASERLAREADIIVKIRAAMKLLGIQ